MAILSDTPKQQFFDDNGNPLSGGKLYTYEAGTSTPKATYTDEGGLTPNANPVILDSRGECNLWLETGSYKFVLKDSADTTIWTVDDIEKVAEGISTTTGASDADKIIRTNPTSGYIDKSFLRTYLTPVTKSTTYTATIYDDLILADTGSGAWTLTLPTALSAQNKVFRIRKTTSDYNALTIDGNGSETINGSTTAKINTQYEELELWSNGSNWQIISRYIPSFWSSASVVPIKGITSDPTKPASPTVDWFRTRRVGDSLEGWFNYYHASGGSDGSGNYYVQLPGSLTINTTNFFTGSSTNLIAVPSQVFLYSGNLSDYSGWGEFFIDTLTPLTTGLQARIWLTSHGGTSFNDVNEIWGSGTSAITWSSALNFRGNFRVPIEGWDS